MAGKNVVHVNAAEWKSEVIDSALPVLVDFWAEWCAPCRALAPVLDELADEMAGKLKIAKVDVDANGELAGQFGVRSIPTLLVFVGGQVKGQMVGAMSKASLQAKLATLVS